MTELEKFKRRLIRTVARLHVQQKKPEDELWEYLRKQTKCDCKWLWERMRALTLKRLKRLLIAEDRQENIPAVARMTLTDWLLFDCILVHEKIDVIGSELLTEGRSSEPRPLFSLFSLVQQFELEGLRGEKLARAWTAATVHYNSGGRQCSPMLLQRRWYQLKEATRAKFYKFWLSFRGNVKLISQALKHKPTRLQSAVAKRYPHVITTPFLEWEELIEKRFVIMPPEFEIQMKSCSGKLPKPIDDNDADLVLLEPEIETIDLGVDSDSDDELRDQVEGSKAKQMIANEDVAAVQSIILKQEPRDDEYHIEEGINLDSVHIEAIDAEINHIEGIEALEKVDIPMEIDNSEETEIPKPPVKKKRGRKKKLPEPIEIDDDDNIDNSDSMAFAEEDTRSSMEENQASKDHKTTVTENITPTPSLDKAITQSSINISSSPTVSEIDVSLAIKDVSSETIADAAISNTESSLADTISPVGIVTPEVETIERPENNVTGEFDGNKYQMVSNTETSFADTISPVGIVTPEVETIELPENNVTGEFDGIKYQMVSNTETLLADKISPIAVSTSKVETTEVAENNVTREFDGNMDESPEMPQITNVFGNVNIPDEELQKLSSYLEKTKSKTPDVLEQDVEDDIEEDIIKTEVTDSTYETNEVSGDDQTSTFKVDENDKSEKNSTSEEFQDNLLNDAIPDMTFEDDGIEFIDEGIVEEQEGDKATKDDELGIKAIKREKTNEEKAPEESQTIDLKLIMVPVVYTMKLEHMDVLRNKVISHVKGEDSIELIVTESRPVSKKSIQIKQEQLPVNETVSDDEEDAHDDLFDKRDDASTAYSSDSEDTMPEETKVPITSVLFQKPRNREYGPLVVCKNPDFNTRLKRLTVGFLSYARNRFLLTACKPLTVDLCKAFESKLVNNTVYLKESPVSECLIKEEKMDTPDENRQTPLVIPQENLEQATVAPTTESLQILVNNMLEKALPQSARESNKEIKKQMEDKEDAKDIKDNTDSIVERNKVIVLPNIDNVRRINQKLLVAEVSPMRMENTNHVPPVSLVSTSMEKLNLPVTEETSVVEKTTVEKSNVKKPNKGNPSGTVICSGQVINHVSYGVRRYYHGAKSKPIVFSNKPERKGFWTTNKRVPNNITMADHLLTIDALNKMLNIVHEKDPVTMHNIVTYKKNLKDKQRSELLRKVDEIQRKLTGESSRSDIIQDDEKQDPDRQTGSNKRTSDETKPPFDFKAKRGKIPPGHKERPGGKRSRSRKEMKIDPSNPNLRYGSYCCWIQFKLNYPKSRNNHPCLLPHYRSNVHCVCCCRPKGESETDPSIKKVCESIESVIEQSRENLKNENNNGNAVHNDSSVHNSKSTNIVDETNISGINDVAVESNVIDITEGENDYTEKNSDLCDNDEKNSTQNCQTENNYEIVGSNVIGLTGIEKNADGINKDINQVGNNSVGTDTNVTINTIEENAVAAYMTISNSQNQATFTDDCVIIDSDEPGTPEKQNPQVKINVSIQEMPPKRKRGRPPLKQPEPIKKVHTHTRTYPRNSRFNLRPIPRKQNEQTDKNVLFLNSNHIKKSNHPIFLGKNKILLTDVPLPRNKDKPVQVEQSPAVINTTLPLPQGVNLVLLPNGVLTCSVDPNVQLTTEELTNLGVIIEGIQKQLTSAASSLLDSAIQLKPTEQISAMQIVSPFKQFAPTMPTVTVPGIIQNSSDDVNDPQKSTDAQSAVHTPSTTAPIDNSIFTGDGDLEANGNIISESEKVTESVSMETDNIPVETSSKHDKVMEIDNNTVQPSSEHDNVMKTDNMTVQTFSEHDKVMEIDNNTLQPSSEHDNVMEADNITVRTSSEHDEVMGTDKITVQPSCKHDEVVETNNITVKNSIEQPNVSESTIPIADTSDDLSGIESERDKQNKSEEQVEPVDDTKETKRAETEPVTKKTILSDLMEMSGIFEEDVALVEPTPPSSEMPQYPEQPIVLTPPLLPIPVPNPVNTLPELTPITSFVELKYACVHNGNFFKLDLETKSLTPINVCIKKKADEIQAKEFVDLTDDADEEESRQKVTPKPNQTLEKKVLATHLEDKLVYIVRKSKAQDTSSNERSILKKVEPAKPLRLFKVLHPFGSNMTLLSKGKRTLESSEDIVSLSESASQAKRSRKQTLTERTIEAPTLNFLTNEEEKEHYEFDGSFEDTVLPDEDSDSSDDEPLAQKVRRKEEALKEAERLKEVSLTVENNEPIAEPSVIQTPENAQDELAPQNEDSELPIPVEQLYFPTAGLEESVRIPEMPAEELEESMLGPSEVEFLSDNDNEEEDCILGV